MPDARWSQTTPVLGTHHRQQAPARSTACAAAARGRVTFSGVPHHLPFSSGTSAPRAGRRTSVKVHANWGAPVEFKAAKCVISRGGPWVLSC